MSCRPGHGEGRARWAPWAILEDRYFRYDDEGYLAQHLDEDIAIVFSLGLTGQPDPVRARTRWEAALDGPYPEGAQEMLRANLPLMSPATRAELEGFADR